MATRKRSCTPAPCEIVKIRSVLIFTPPPLRHRVQLQKALDGGDWLAIEMLDWTSLLTLDLHVACFVDSMA
jgi:hypothetical protein